MATNDSEPFDQDATVNAPSQEAPVLSAQEQTALDESEYPDLTPGQVRKLRAGKLPGEIVLHAVSLLVALIALVIAIAAFAR